MYQRQLSKEGLQQVVDGGAQGAKGAGPNLMSMEELRDLFRCGVWAAAGQCVACRCPVASPGGLGQQGRQAAGCLHMPGYARMGTQPGTVSMQPDPS